MNFPAYYQNKLSQKNYKADDCQIQASNLLQEYYNSWLKTSNTGIVTTLIKFFQPDKINNNGIYFWGGVGRGKSFLMDSFFEYITFDKKIRIHFHEFMRQIHKDLEKLRGKANPIDIVAKNIAKAYQVICFDEFHINDIADAMIFDKLFIQLFKLEVFFIITSNYEPTTLYKNGLHRDRFLPAIMLLQKHLKVFNLDNGNDYRMRSLEQIDIYHTPINSNTDKLLNQAFDKIAQMNDEDSILYIENRQIKSKRKAGSTAWFTFSELCDSPRSQNDYLELSLQFNTIILSDIPYMPPKMSTQARRFTWLIDIMYDHKVNLIMSAEVSPNNLHTQGLLSEEFHRTVSRIIEMQSKEYLEQSHRLHVR